MAWQQSDLDTIDAALTRGTRKVTFADGRSVEYHSPEEMLAVRRKIKEELAAAESQINPRTRVTVARFRR